LPLSLFQWINPNFAVAEKLAVVVHIGSKQKHCITLSAMINPVKVFQWYRTENDVPHVEMFNATSSGTGSALKDGRTDYNDKSDPIREYDCIWCMACLNASHAKAIKVSEGNLVYHQQAAQSPEKVQ
jgi:NAD-dependent dihydropyrimidine dehydrogenase PreA subunit